MAIADLGRIFRVAVPNKTAATTSPPKNGIKSNAGIFWPPSVSRRSFLARERTGPAPWQAPQPARREDDGEERGHAERDGRPDEEEGSAGIGDLGAKTRPLHVEDGNQQPKERPEEDDDVARSPFGEHQRSVQPDGQDGYNNEV